MDNNVAREDAHFKVIKEFVMRSVAEAAFLAKAEKWVNIFLPLRSLLLHLILNQSYNQTQARWAALEKELSELGDLSVHSMTQRLKAEETKHKLVSCILAKKDQIGTNLILEPCAFVMVLFAVGAILQWPQ